MGLITASGIGSNVDVDSIITALVDARRIPATDRLDFKEARAQASISGLGSLASSLDALKTSLAALSSAADFSKRAATSSDTEFVTVSAGTSATPAEFSVDVIKLAQGSRLESTLFADSSALAGNGNLTFTAGSESFSVTISATDTISEVRDKINDAASNFGVNANIINGDAGTILVLDSSLTGAANQLVVTNDNASLDAISTNLNTPVDGAASDAEITINGQTITNTTNTFSDAIEDISITVEKVTTESVEVSISLDNTAVKATIESFVKSFNELSKTVSVLGKSVPGSPGILAGDATLRLVNNQIRRIVGSSVSGLSGAVASLAELGIKTTADGTLEIDDSVLTSALEENFSDISDIFISDNGISKSLITLVDQYTNSSGILTTRTELLSDSLGDISDERTKLNASLFSLETRLRAQYGAMDALVAQLTSTGNFLTQQLANLPGATQNKDK